MNDKKFLLENDAEQAQGEAVSHRRIYGAILAALVCIALALAVWIGVMNAQDTDYIPVRIVSPEGYECTLSVDGVEVEGKVSDLRNLDEITVALTKDDAAYVIVGFGGEASVNEAFLRLPEGV